MGNYCCNYAEIQLELYLSKEQITKIRNVCSCENPIHVSALFKNVFASLILSPINIDKQLPSFIITNPYYQKNFKTIQNLNGFYQGQTQSQKRNGKGRFCIPNQLYYQGQWRNDKLNGRGKLFLINKDYYQGQFHDNKFQGEGFLITKQFKYQGEWKQDMYHGKGKKIFKNKDSYQGNYRNGLKNGKGVYHWNELNQCYEGDFQNNELHGKGTLKLKNSIIYKGNWQHNKKSQDFQSMQLFNDLTTK